MTALTEPDLPSSLSIDEIASRVHSLHQEVQTEIGRVVVGMEKVVRRLLIALLAGGHVLLEGVPGVAKTTLSKTFANILGCEYHRVQFTPDLLPADVTGTFVYDRKTSEFVLRKGPIFCQVLLADEINRAPAKTQSALLEAMQEMQVTIEGTTLPLPQPFIVLATQNPVEQEGVYRLPEAQLDRFLLRVHMGYPGHDLEVRMLQMHSKPTSPTRTLFSPESIQAYQARIGDVHGKPELMHYIVRLAELSRKHADVALGASPRAALSLLRCARARALVYGRSFFTHEDVQAMAESVLAHRLILRPEAEIEGKHVNAIIADLIRQMPITFG